jgi:Bacterial Ig domain
MKGLFRFYVVLLTVLGLPGFSGVMALAATVPLQTMVPIAGEIERITINNAADFWSGGTMTVGGQVIILPRNLLINLPNDYQTLQQLYANAPSVCRATGETGLAKTDKCNGRATGAQVDIKANRTDHGNVIAGQVDVFKALEVINGTITYISYNSGYFRVNGIPNDATTGTMIRVNDPTSRHTVQSGLGCAAGTPNCSPDVRFHIDADNYTFNFETGYPPCIPITANGLNDVNCPDSNRPAQPLFPGASGPAVTNVPNYPAPVPVPDATRFAPIKLGDRLTASGSFETVNGVTFLSAWSVNVRVDLTTRAGDPTQPDYLFINELGWHGPAYNQARVWGRILVTASDHNAPLDYFSIHYDPINNAPHEMPLYSAVNNTAQGAVIQNGAPTGVFDAQIRMDWIPPIKVGKHFEEPCAALFNAGVVPDASGAPVNIATYCPNGGETLDNFNLMAPVPREIMVRSRHQHAVRAQGITARDIHGNPTQFGQYKLPTTIEYGAFEDLNLLMFDFPFTFSGTPWLMDRRLSPNGCSGPCEPAPQPLDPFPFEGTDPRTVLPVFGLVSPVAPVPLVLPNPDRMLNFMKETATPGVFAMTGLLAWPPASPPAIAITPAQEFNFFAPDAVNDSASTGKGKPVTINVLANDVPTLGIIDHASVTIVTSTPANGTHTVNFDGTITYTPALAFTGTDTFTYAVANNFGTVSNAATVTVTVIAPPTANPDTASVTVGSQESIDVIANDSAGSGTLNPASVTVVTGPSCGSLSNRGNGTFLFTAPGAVGTCTFSYKVSDTLVPPQTSAAATVTVTINPGIQPEAKNDTVVTTVGAVIPINVIANDTATSPAAIDPASVVLNLPVGVQATVDAVTGIVTYTAPNVAGTYTFTYTVRDTQVPAQTSNFATVTVTVTAPPVAGNDTATMTAGTGASVTINVIANDSPLAALNPASVIVTQPAHGAAVANANGTVTYTPNAAYVSPPGTPDTFTYTVKNNLGLISNPATVAVTVNSAPSSEVLTVTRAQYTVNGSSWRIDGTTNAGVVGETMTVYNNPTVGTAPLGQPVLVNGGSWTLQINNSPTTPNGQLKISVQSSLNPPGVLNNVTLTVR